MNTPAACASRAPLRARALLLLALCAALPALWALWRPAPPAYADTTLDATAATLVQTSTALTNGDLLQATGDDKIFLLENGQRRWIADTQSLQRLNPDFSRLRHIPFDELDRLPPGRPYRDGPVIRDNTTGKVYLLVQETGWTAPRRRWVNDLDAFTRLGFVWTDVATDWPTPAANYADAPTLSYRPVSRDLTTVQTSLGPLMAVPAWRLQVQDDRLFEALALAATYNAVWRSEVAPRLTDAGTWIEWGSLPADAAGAFSTSLNRILVNASQGGQPGLLATTLTHEALHAVYQHGPTAQSCVAEEASAYAIEVQTWTNLPAQYRPSGSPEAQFEEQLATLWQQRGLSGLQLLVAGNTAYQQECGIS